MTDTVPTWRQAISDSNHPLHKAAWIIFEPRMNAEFANKQLADQKDQVIPFLFEILDTPALLDDSSLGSGLAPVNAVSLLEEWKVVEAIPRLIRLFEDNTWEAMIRGHAVSALEKMGPPALEPLLALAARTTDENTRTILAGAISEAGRRDPRAWAYVKALFEKQKQEEDIKFMAENLLLCDRDQAIPLLEEKFKQGKYTKKLRQVLEGYIAAARKPEFEAGSDETGASTDEAAPSQAG